MYMKAYSSRGKAHVSLFLLLKEHLKIYFNFTAAGVVPCGGRKKSPRTSSIVQIIYFILIL